MKHQNKTISKQSSIHLAHRPIGSPATRAHYLYPSQSTCTFSVQVLVLYLASLASAILSCRQDLTHMMATAARSVLLYPLSPAGTAWAALHNLEKLKKITEVCCVYVYMPPIQYQQSHHRHYSAVRPERAKGKKPFPEASPE